MARPLTHPLNLDKQLSVKASNTIKQLRKVRLICCDPDLTDSSDDERSEKRKKKCVVHEINIGQSPNNNKKGKGGAWPSPSSSNHRGIRKKKWDKLTTEVTDSFKVGRVWLGTYNTAEESKHTHEMNRVVFDSLIALEKSHLSASNVHTPLVLEDSESLLSYSLPSPVQDLETSASGFNVHSSGENGIKEGSGTDTFDTTQFLAMASLNQFSKTSGLEEPLDIVQELNLGFGLDSPFVDECGRLGDGLCGLRNLSVVGFEGEQPTDLDFDFDMGNFELGNIACP